MGLPRLRNQEIVIINMGYEYGLKIIRLDVAKLRVFVKSDSTWRFVISQKKNVLVRIAYKNSEFVASSVLHFSIAHANIIIT